MGRRRAQPSRLQRAHRAAFAAVLAGALLTAPGADARRPAIKGRVTAPYTVIALAQNGHERSERVRGKFAIVPPARTVTLHLVDGDGVYLGPVVARGRGGRAVVRVRAGAKLGTLRVKNGWVKPGRRIASRRFDRGRPARARNGVPIGAGVLGRVRAPAVGPDGPGRDQDLDGLPGRFDVDDDGDLVLDTQEASRPRAPRADLVTGGGTGAVDAGFDDDDDDTALIIAIAAAALGLTSLLWQIGSALARRRRRGVEVEARLGLPVYSQRAGRWAVFIEVHNRTDHPVRWIAAALEMRDRRMFYLMDHPTGGELPAVIAPHDSHHTWVDCHELESQGLALDEPVVAAAKLATGETYYSTPKRLAPRRSRLFN